MTDVTVLSSFDWSVPGTPEMITETAALGGMKTLHFIKPKSIFSSSSFLRRNDVNIETKRLRIISARFANFGILENFQNIFVSQQIKKNVFRKYPSSKNSILIYTNLESIVGILPLLRPVFKTFIYICADYSKLDHSFCSNAFYADKILTIPKSMVSKINKIYPQKAIHWPQMTSYIPQEKKLSKETNNILKIIPKPRALYTGLTYPRIDLSLYKMISDKLPHLSFITFTNGKKLKVDKNRYEIPWIAKAELFSLIKECDIGFMPYNIKDPHNLHCVPLKLFEYFYAGIPVISTQLLNISEFQPHVYLANSHQDFIHGLSSLISSTQSPRAIKERKQIANRHSTKNLTIRLESILSN